MADAFGPDVWKNAPEKSSPVAELLAWLGQMDAAAGTWTPKANEVLWRERFAGVKVEIGDAIAALPLSDVFARPEGARLYDAACKRYQDVKDAFLLSQDWILTITEQAGVSPVAPDFIDKAMAFLRSLGIGLAGAAVLLIVVVILVRRAVS
jgi:hypothetical protein